MAKRLRVLLSAYACEPGKGSEPEQGWQWAMHMAQYHDVTVLTRTNNRTTIEAEIQRLGGKQPLPRFVFHDCRSLLLSLKRRVLGVKGYLWFWEKSARVLIAKLHQAEPFDLMHHVTIAGFRYPTAIIGHNTPTILGPVGGVECTPWRLLPWQNLHALTEECIRNVDNWVQTFPGSRALRQARKATVVLASTREMQTLLSRFCIPSLIMPPVGWAEGEQSAVRIQPRFHQELRLLFVGRIVFWKGVELAIDALAASGTKATLGFFGEGNLEGSLRRRVHQHGLQNRVHFGGRVDRNELLAQFPTHDSFLLPTLHDTGPAALIEAMAHGLPPICLDCGGPAIAVAEGCGQKIPLGSRRQVITGLAEAIRRYEQDESLRLAHGRAARQTILDRYEWNRKAEQMNEVYQMAVEKFAREQGGA